MAFAVIKVILAAMNEMPDDTSPTDPQTTARTRRQASLARIAGQPLRALDGTLADAVGQSNRERLVWSGLLAMPLLFPVALPGTASAVGAFSLLIACGLLSGRPLPLPDWLARREIHERARQLLARMLGTAIRIMAALGRPRLLQLSAPGNRMVNGLLLATAAVAMMIPVPIISFDNVLPALAIVLLSWGLRLRDGLMLLAGYLFTAVAVASVVLLWWGGASLAEALLQRLGLGP